MKMVSSFSSSCSLSSPLLLLFFSSFFSFFFFNLTCRKSLYFSWNSSGYGNSPLSRAQLESTPSLKAAGESKQDSGRLQAWIAGQGGGAECGIQHNASRNYSRNHSGTCVPESDQTCPQSVVWAWATQSFISSREPSALMSGLVRVGQVSGVDATSLSSAETVWHASLSKKSNTPCPWWHLQRSRMNQLEQRIFKIIFAQKPV